MLRKLKKKETEQQNPIEIGLVCNVCDEKFESKNQLFKHLKDKGHEMRK